MAYKATKQFKFEMAHRLPSHKGDCRYIHGHSYLIEVTAEANSQLDSNGMVVDFSQLKRFCNLVIGNWDHALMLYKNDPLVSALNHLHLFDGVYAKLIQVDYEPTAENMAEYLYNRLNDMIKSDNRLGEKLNYFISKVTVWETATSYAEFSR